MWCSMGGQGVCLTEEQSDIAQQMSLQCDSTRSIAAAAVEFQSDVESTVDGSPYDVTCALAGFSAGDAGQDACDSTVDQDGEPCVWCGAGGLCLTHDQVDIAEQAGVECGSDNLADNPYDVTCAIAGYTAGDEGETVCKTTQDQDGDACVWCSMGGQGVCLNDYQASIASQMSLQCDEVDVVSDPIPPIVKECLKNLHEVGCNAASDENGDKCSWCTTVSGFGVCFCEEAKKIAQQSLGPLFHCDDAASTKVAIE